MICLRFNEEKWAFEILVNGRELLATTFFESDANQLVKVYNHVDDAFNEENDFSWRSQDDLGGE